MSNFALFGFFIAAGMLFVETMVIVISFFT